MFGENMTNILQAEGVRDIVNLTQYPIGRINDSFAFCHHGGWYECDLQTHALCARALKPSDRWAMFNFVECSFANLNVDDVDSTRQCSQKVGLNYTDMWQCATGRSRLASGPRMLLSSIEEATARGVHSAPTVYLNGEQIGHSITLELICDAYTGLKPAGCTSKKARAATPRLATVSRQCHA